MNLFKLVGIVALAIMVPGASATHIEPCNPTSADPSSVNTISFGGRTFYVEERGNPFGIPIPLSAFFFGPDADGDGLPELFEGEGTWVYEESNGLDGLQRGGCGGGFGPAGGRQLDDDCTLGNWFPPGCDQNPDWVPTDGTVPCLIIDEDPINDETCHFGPDLIIF